MGLRRVFCLGGGFFWFPLLRAPLFGEIGDGESEGGEKRPNIGSNRDFQIFVSKIYLSPPVKH